MLRSLISQLAKKRSTSPTLAAVDIPNFEAGALVFISKADAPSRIASDAKLYSDLASVRLRTIPIALNLAANRPVYVVPPRFLAGPAVLEAMRSVETYIITKFSTDEVLRERDCFQMFIDWLETIHGQAQLIADFTDNYAAYGESIDVPFLRTYQEALCRYCILTVPSEALRQELSTDAKYPVHVIEDPFESLASAPPKAPTGDPIHLCWFGNIGESILAPILAGLVRAAEALQGRNVVLQMVTDPRREALVSRVHSRLAQVHATLRTELVPWSLESTWQAIARCDLVLLPQDHRSAWGRVKSHNRLIETIRGGRWAIASPIPSYLELKEYAWVGEDFAEGIRWALANPGQVVERIAKGQEYVAARFSRESFLSKWDRVLSDRERVDTNRVAIPSEPSKAATASQVRLNLGCGDKLLPGYINVDVAESRAGRSPDILCDLHRLDPFEQDSADEILAVHVVEHFWRWEVVDILKEWTRVLKPGGRMILECPNLLSACEELLKNPTQTAGPGLEGQRTMWVLYGDPAWKDPLMCHRWNYTPHSLSDLMTEAGLVKVRQEPAQYKLREPRDMRIVAEKPLNSAPQKTALD